MCLDCGEVRVSVCFDGTARKIGTGKCGCGSEAAVSGRALALRALVEETVVVSSAAKTDVDDSESLLEALFEHQMEDGEGSSFGVTGAGFPDLLSALVQALIHS